MPGAWLTAREIAPALAEVVPPSARWSVEHDRRERDVLRTVQRYLRDLAAVQGLDGVPDVRRGPRGRYEVSARGWERWLAWRRAAA